MLKANQGLILGLLGVSLFALTLPLTKIVVAAIGIYETTFLRSTLTGIIALAFLIITRSSIPKTAYELRLLFPIIVSIGLGFPIGTAYAMQYLPPGQGGVVLGLTPLLTAIYGAYISRQRLPFPFWVATFFGFLVISFYSLIKNNWQFSHGEIGLLIASISAAIGYSKAGMLSKSMDSRDVISWVMATSLVFNAPLVYFFAGNDVNVLTENLMQPKILIAFLLLSVITMYIANFFWYKGLSLGGVANVSQILFLQPLITLFYSAFFWDEEIQVSDYVAIALLLVIIVFSSRNRSITVKNQ